MIYRIGKELVFPMPVNVEPDGLLCVGGEIVDLGVEYGIIQKSGSWYSYNGSKLAQGRDATKSLLKDNPELMEELEALIKQAIADKREG